MASGNSYNGWPANSDKNAIGIVPFGDPQGLPFPGGVKSGDVFAVLGYVAIQFNARVEPIVAGWDWGYTYKQNVNNPSSLSCHASGTALDINAPSHPNGSGGTFTDAQVGTIYAILDEVQGAVDWLEGYDEMHFEICVSASTLARVAASLPTNGGGATDMPLNEHDIELIRNVIDERINAHFGAGAVNDPGAALNSGVSPRMHLDRQADLAADPG